jgi:hypothetical protein
MSQKQTAPASMKPMSAQEEIKALKAKIESLNKQIPTLTSKNKVTVKVGEKGSINFYGLGKKPVCLYLSQLTRLLEAANAPEFQAFLQENDAKIAKKVAVEVTE